MESETRLERSSENANLDLAIEVVKEEIASQSDAFDQLDTKSGVLLGFAMIAVAQVFSGVLRLVSDNQPLSTGFNGLLAFWFLLGTAAVLVATAAAVAQRLPQDIYNNISTDEEDLRKTEDGMKRDVWTAYKDAAKSNEKTLSRKANLARTASFAVGVALISLVLATVTLFMSIPRTRPTGPSSPPIKASCELRVC